MDQSQLSKDSKVKGCQPQRHIERDILQMLATVTNATSMPHVTSQPNGHKPTMPIYGTKIKIQQGLCGKS